MRAKIISATLCCLALLGCGKVNEAGSYSEAASAVIESPAEAATAKSNDASEKKAKTVSVEQQLSSSATSTSDSTRQFIRNADAKFRVKDVYQSALAIEDIVAQIGGFVEKNAIRSEIHREQNEAIGDGKIMKLSEYIVRGELVVRVPSDKTQIFLRQIAGQVAFLDERTFTAQDAQFELLRQKLGISRNQKTQQDLGKIVEDGGKIEDKADVLIAQNDVKHARDEAVVREKEFLDRVAYSSISLGLYQLPQVQTSEITDIAAVFAANRPSFFHRLGNEIKSGWSSALNLIVALASVWPFLLILTVIVVLLIRWKCKAAEHNKITE